jgi:alkyl hydroperoxide reductase subunit F
MYELTIIGGGPAGVAGGVYAARKQLDTKLITESFGGQSEVSTEIKNWIGTKSISGSDWADELEEHVRDYEGEYLDISTGTKATNLEPADKDGFIVVTDNGDEIRTKTVLIASGAHRRKLKIPGAEEFENKGVVYCASCDGPLFAGQEVAVVGGGNAGFEAAAQLASYTEHVTILQHSDQFKADPSTIEQVLNNDNVTAIKNAEPREITGSNFVGGITYEDLETGDMHELDVSGVFVEIGIVPNTDFVADLLDMNEVNQIVVDPETQQASVEGVWAAGDATDGLYHQNNIAAGDAVKAIEDIYLWLKTN